MDTGSDGATSAELPSRLIAAAVRSRLGLPGTEPVREHATHISRVFVAGDRAFKLKRPLVLAFLDYGTAQRRWAMCQEEVRLNRRLAPDVYLAVRALVADGPGLRIAEAGAGTAIDYLVEMRRYDETATLAARLSQGGLDAGDLTALCRCLAAFHGQAPPTVEADGVSAVRREIGENLAELAPLLCDGEEQARMDALTRFFSVFASRHRALLRTRGQQGHRREGHGDLRAEHVLLGPPVQIVDCVEFDPGLRTIDTADDLAFLVMDLCAREAETLARSLMTGYREAGGDHGPEELVWFYAAHRALVRAKVARLNERHGDAEAASRLLATAARCAWRARGPIRLVICGPAASGKSRLAQAVAERFGVTVLDSDVVRKELAGLSPTERGADALYGAAMTERTYARLAERAEAELSAGRSVIVAATCRRRPERRPLVGGPWSARTWWVRCQAPLSMRRRWARDREDDPERASDATESVVAEQGDSFDALDEVTASHRVTMATDRSTHLVLAELMAWLDSRPDASARCA
ncbi:MAG TPA: AAA family ATPase [Solirubrobacteraceae bacterium]|nr:AAA family ATPase [Solirubrobacteraceae bacterium]